MSAEPRLAREIREFHAPYWRAWAGLRAHFATIEEAVPELKGSLASLFEQGYTLTDVGMMLGLTRERVRQYAVRFSLSRPPRHAARVWDDSRRQFIALPETVGRRAAKLASAASHKARVAKRHQHLSRMQEHFWAQVVIPTGEGCWIWQGSHYRFGKHRQATEYGTYRGWFVHRLSFLWANGYVPMGRKRGALVVAHSCDNGLCVNPNHLVPMTHKENIQDSMRKGRFTAALKREQCKKHGHPIEIYGDGKRRCRICTNHYNREYYHRQKARAHVRA
jgi:hypothetical protein